MEQPILMPHRENEPVPAWAVLEMTRHAQWSGRWCGCADGLARLLRRHVSDPDVAHALKAYDELREWYETPVLLVDPEPAEQS